MSFFAAWLDGLDLLMGINAWLSLRLDQALAPPQAQRAMLAAVKAMLAVKRF